MSIGVAIILFIIWVIVMGSREKERGTFGRNFILPIIISILMIIFIFGGFIMLAI